MNIIVCIKFIGGDVMFNMGDNFLNIGVIVIDNCMIIKR